jgi:NhaP-type Na+/H+ or K+/H+ antiporter
MSEIVNAIGTVSLGAYVGWLGRYFVRRFKTFTPSVLGALLSVLLGAVIIRFLSGNPNLWGYYPIGLVIGFLFYHFTVLHLMKSKRNQRKGAVNIGKTRTISHPVTVGDDLSDALVMLIPKISFDPPDVV